MLRASRDVWGDEVARYIGVENDQRAMRLARDLALDHGTSPYRSSHVVES